MAASNLPAFLASLLSALLAAYLCSESGGYSSGAPGLLARALAYVSVCFFAGTAGAWFYWNPHCESPSIRDFTLWCGSGWIWAPAVVLLLQQESLYAAPAAAFGAAALARGLKRANQATCAHLPIWPSKSRQIFAESQHAFRRDWQPYLISMCLYVAFFAFWNSLPIVTCGVLTVGAFLFALQLSDSRDERPKQALGRLVATLIGAIFVTAAVLWPGPRGSTYGLLNGRTDHRVRGSGDQLLDRSDHHPANGQTVGARGYQSIVLLPPPQKKQILPPLRASSALAGVRFTKPLNIPFDGAYWYFQAPHTQPSPHAHVAKGDPLNIEIHSSDFMPLVMEAHQKLSNPVPLSRCREIRVIIRSRDNQRGSISVGMRLGNSTSAGTPTLFVGSQPIISSEPDHFRIKHQPLEETLRFQVPRRPVMREFDQITLTVIQERARLWNGAKIAVQGFELLPR